VVGTVDPDIDATTPPLRQVAALDARKYFALAADLMKQHPPHFNDGPMVQRLARLGLIAGESFDFGTCDPVVQEALTTAPGAAMAKITAYQARVGVPRDGWITLAEGMGSWGTDYLKRATVDLMGLGANLPADAIYPLSYIDADDEPYSGTNDYVLHFDGGELPPAQAFWSLTLYDAEGFQVANELNRFAIGDRDALAHNADGSLDLEIQHTEPARGTSNWLPAPEDGFNLCMRIYYPHPDALDGTWLAPAVTKN
jgi:hypothetical protein